MWSLFPFPIRIIFHGHSNGALSLLPSNPCPLPSLNRDCYIFLPSTVLAHVRDDICTRDAEYLAKCFIHKRLHFEEQSFGQLLGFRPMY